MPMIIAFLVFAIVAILSYFIINLYTSTADPMEMRIKAVEGFTQRRTDAEAILSKSFSERFLVPLAEKFQVFKLLSPNEATRYIEKRLELAGGMAGLSAGQYIALNGLLVTVLVITSIVISLICKWGLFGLIKAICYSILLGILVPNFMVSRKITARQESIQKDLPDVLDLVTVSVEAGLGFDGALGKLSEKMSGTLVDEFGRVLQEMRMGVTRRDALKALSKRCDNKDLSLFISALVQADQLGVSIGKVLRAQSIAIRQNRRNQIEQKATKAPIKMLFPLVVCIFPSLFIILLGPAMLKIMGQL